MARMRLAAVLMLAAASLALAEDDLPAEGQPAPGFRLRALDPAAGGQLVSLDRLVGEEPEDAGCRAVLLTFSASWCVPCQKELPLLQQLHQTYGERGLRVIAVNTDEEE